MDCLSGYWNFKNLLECFCKNTNFNADSLCKSFKIEANKLIVDSGISYDNLFKTCFSFCDFSKIYAIYLDDQVLLNYEKWNSENFSNFTQIHILFHELSHRLFFKSGVNESDFGEFIAEYLAVKTMINYFKKDKTMVNYFKKDIADLIYHDCVDMTHCQIMGAFLAAEIIDNKLLSANEQDRIKQDLKNKLQFINKKSKIKFNSFEK